MPIVIGAIAPHGIRTIPLLSETADGAMGTMIQSYQLAEKDYRGERFAGWPRDLRGNNDLLSLTQPTIIRAPGTRIDVPLRFLPCADGYSVQSPRRLPEYLIVISWPCMFIFIVPV